MQNLLEKIGGAFVGKMAVPAGDALLEVRRAQGVVAQEVEVVIGFEQEDFTFAYAVGNEAGAVAEIGEPANSRGGGVDHKPHRLNGIVRNGKGFDRKIADFKWLAGFKNAKLKIAFVNAPDFVRGVAVAINGNAELGIEHAQGLDVVDVFVGDENAIESLRGAVQSEQGIANAFGAEAAIDEHARAGRFQVCGVAAGAAAENGKSNLLHARKYTARASGAQFNFIHTLCFGQMGLYLRNPLWRIARASSLRAIGLAFARQKR